MKLSTFPTLNKACSVLCKKEVNSGDHILIRTQNSYYELQALENCRFRVSGGWFARENKGDVYTTVMGCGLGGTTLKNGIIAECGLRIEFGNRVVTSPVSSFVKFKYYQLN